MKVTVRTICVLSLSSFELTLHPVAERARMQHNLAPNVGLKAKAEMKDMDV